MQRHAHTSTDPIGRVTSGMRVVDVAGEEVGAVVTVTPGDPNAVTAQDPPDSGSGVLAGKVPHTEDGDEPDVPPDVAARLLRTGYLKVDGGGPRGRGLYVQADQIADVTGDVVALAVTRAGLNPEA